MAVSFDLRPPQEVPSEARSKSACDLIDLQRCCVRSYRGSARRMVTRPGSRRRLSDDDARRMHMIGFSRGSAHADRRCGSHAGRFSTDPPDQPSRRHQDRPVLRSSPMRVLLEPSRVGAATTVRQLDGARRLEQQAQEAAVNVCALFHERRRPAAAGLNSTRAQR